MRTKRKLAREAKRVAQGLKVAMQASQVDSVSDAANIVARALQLKKEIEAGLHPKLSYILATKAEGQISPEDIIGPTSGCRGCGWA